MKLTCNIDKRGRRTRLVGGILVDLCGAIVIVIALRAGWWEMLTGGIFLCVAGSFMIFEGARGWCALRAMGIRTPM